MHPGGRQANECVSGFDPHRIDRPAQGHDPHREARQVEIAIGVEVGHLGRLAAEKRAAGDLAAAGYALDDLGGTPGVVAVHTEVIQEEQRLGTLNDQVVDVHRHAVDADGVVDAQLGRELDLGADAVGARHENRVAVVLPEQLLVVIEAEHAREAAEAAKDPRSVSPPHR